MRLNFFEHRTFVLVTKSSIFVRSGSFFVGKLHLSHIWGYSKKNWASEPFWTGFYQFSKKYPRSMRLNFFENRTFVLVTKSSIFVRSGSIFVGKLHLSHSWGYSKKNWASEPFWTRFYQFSKKYPRSMRLNFFEHRTLIWSPNRQLLSDLAHFLWSSSTWAIVGDKLKNLSRANLFGHVFTNFQKKVSALDEA